MGRNLVTPEAMARKEVRRVYFNSAVAVNAGQALCFQRTTGTAANADEKRDNYVELPSASNNMWFAGVSADTKAAQTGGQWINMYEPGAVCPVAVRDDTVVGVTHLTFIGQGADAGYFRSAGLDGGFRGRGSCLALQTVTAQLAGETDGTGELDTTGLILTGVGFDTPTGHVAAGDKVQIVHGDDGAVAVIPGEYTVSSVTSDTVLVLTAVAAETGGTPVCNYYVVAAGAPTLALAKLEDGEESGGIDFVCTGTGAALSVPAVPLIGGMTFCFGPLNIAGNATYTLADGTHNGMRKGFYLTGALTTSDIAITVTSGGSIVAAGGLLATASLDGIGEIWAGTWYASDWHTDMYNGVLAS